MLELEKQLANFVKSKDFLQTVKSLQQTLDQFKFDLKLSATKDELERKIKTLSINVDTKLKQYTTLKHLDKNLQQVQNQIAAIADDIHELRWQRQVLED